MPVAVVTGASSGIGRATARQLASEGYDLVLHARKNLQGLQETAALIRQAKEPETKQPGEAAIVPALLAVTADVACARSCRDLVHTAFGWRSRVDAWVNIAGADVLTGEARHWSFEEKLTRLWSTDVLGTVRLSRLAADQMLQQSPNEHLKPCIVTIGWDQASQGMEGEAGQLFCTTKSAVEAFTRALALSVGPAVRVNAVAPGWIQTRWGQQSSQYWQSRARSESILDRWGRPDDVAQTIAWLVSKQAEFINGQVIAVNGGFRATNVSTSKTMHSEN